jgi:peptide-methionine (R)-S-oxide reductase
METRINKTEEEWQQELTPEEYRVLRQRGTEMPFTGEYVHNKADGTYSCAACGQPLFMSDTKFESGSGWPSFWDVIQEGNVELRTDRSHGMIRTEVRSTHGDSHLGHVFEDGPLHMGGLRYCINSASLRFVPKEKMVEEGYGDYLDQVGEV